MASSYLKRTFSTATNRKIWTWSAWVKRQNVVSDYQNALFGAWYNSSNRSVIRFNGHKLNFQDSGNSVEILTNRKFQDAGAWYHIVARVDTTQSTASDRVRLYVNGVQETSFATANYPNQNINMEFQGAVEHYINARQSSGGIESYADMSFSHVHFADGQSLAPTVFGSTDSTTGEWKINSTPSFTLGTNGFTILKDGHTYTDQSSNSNNWTLVGTITKTEDNPSNNFATLTPSGQYIGSATLSNGNTSFACGSSQTGRAMTTIRPSSGKYYCEYKITNASRFQIGIMNETETFSSQGGSDTNSAILGYEGKIYYNNSLTGVYGSSSFSNGDIIMVAIDCDNDLAWFGKNGSWFNSATATEIQNATATNSFTTFISSQNPMSGQVAIFVEDNSGTGSHDGSFNFGNGYFGTTAVSSAGTNASGFGIFEYDVPTGYTALCTKGLNE